MNLATYVILSTATLGGCFAPAAPRLADVNDRGRLSIMATLPFAGFAPGSADGKRVGNTAGAIPAPGFLAVLMGVGGMEVSANIGTGHGCEVGAIFGVNRLGGEARCVAVDEDDGDSVSVAPFVRGGYQPGTFFLARGPWFAAGTDLSVGRDLRAVAFSPTISYGAESHSIPQARDGGPDEENFIAVGRREWRASLPIGVAFTVVPTTMDGMNPPKRDGTRAGRLMFGVVPYWTFAHGAPTCGDCESVAESTTARTFSEDWGFIVLIAGGSLPLPPLP
jgi:hypothetical protein